MLWADFIFLVAILRLRILLEFLDLLRQFQDLLLKVILSRCVSTSSRIEFSAYGGLKLPIIEFVCTKSLHLIVREFEGVEASTSEHEEALLRLRQLRLRLNNDTKFLRNHRCIQLDLADYIEFIVRGLACLEDTEVDPLAVLHVLDSDRIDHVFVGFRIPIRGNIRLAPQDRIDPRELVILSLEDVSIFRQHFSFAFGEAKRTVKAGVCHSLGPLRRLGPGCWLFDGVLALPNVFVLAVVLPLRLVWFSGGIEVGVGVVGFTRRIGVTRAFGGTGVGVVRTQGK